MSSPEGLYPVAVRTLCDFTAKRGDLDRRFAPAPSAEDGIAAHVAVAARRGPDYRTEVSLCGNFEPLQVRGRADGYDPAQHRLEEFKTVRGDPARIAENQRSLHWAQLKTYGALLCERDAKAGVDLALVYIDIDRQAETILHREFKASELMGFVERSAAQFAAWARAEIAHRSARDRALSEIGFPYPRFHTGQRRFAEAVYRAANAGRCLLAQAPTGIGKTIGAVFPLLKAIAAGKIDKIFYLAAKSTGRRLALNAIESVRAPVSGLPLRTLELVAREKACAHPDKACHGESCPLARGFYDRLAPAREAALALGTMDQAALARVAAEHRVCPYYLSQDLIRWSDVVIGDYHYYFDRGGLLFALMIENAWRVGVLVDEAHNLVERARQMNSAGLTGDELGAALRAAPTPIIAPLRFVARRWSELCARHREAYTLLRRPPERLLAALRDILSRLDEYAADGGVPLEPALEKLYFSARQLCRLAESFGDHSLTDLERGASAMAGAARLSIRNIVPADFLKDRFERAHCVALFSGTLTPARFYQDLLGLPASARWLDVPSPFAADQLSVRVVSDVSTRFRDREGSLAPICALVSRQFAAVPGNYLVFASSFDYLERLFARFTIRHPGIDSWIQGRSMLESDRQQFLDRFVEDGRGIGFAVLGGALAEGVDLPGRRLVGAFIATLGLPQINPINDATMRRLGDRFGRGPDYAYLFPGLARVAQAAGRVIRSTSDRGTLYLIDDRYRRPKVRALLPAWWRID